MDRPRTPTRPAPPFQAIRARASGIAGLDPALLPRRWELLGDVLVLRLPTSLERHREALGAAYGEALGARTVLQEVGRISGPWRVPRLRKIWGDDTETVHRENGVRYKLDAARIMFSSGNLPERIWIAGIAEPGERVVDLFAGIGYFSLPLAVHGRPRRVVACEMNPVAYSYLLENIRLNRASLVEARFGDCREVAPAGIADRILMGHFDAEKYLDVAFRAAADASTIHVHGLVGRRQFPDDGAFEDRIATQASRLGFRIETSEVRTVKSYGPKARHVVVDAHAVRAKMRKGFPVRHRGRGEVGPWNAQAVG